jgi:hypothetical protein
MSECPICKGELWVCENHPDTAWGYGDGCCDGAGMPCECNPCDEHTPPRMPPGTIETWNIHKGTVH